MTLLPVHAHHERGEDASFMSPQASIPDYVTRPRARITVRYRSRLCENSQTRFSRRTFFSISPLRKNIAFGGIHRKKRIEKTILRSSEFSHSLGRKRTCRR